MDRYILELNHYLETSSDTSKQVALRVCSDIDYYLSNKMETSSFMTEEEILAFDNLLKNVDVIFKDNDGYHKMIVMKVIYAYLLLNDLKDGMNRVQILNDNLQIPNSKKTNLDYYNYLSAMLICPFSKHLHFEVSKSIKRFLATEIPPKQLIIVLDLLKKYIAFGLSEEGKKDVSNSIRELSVRLNNLIIDGTKRSVKESLEKKKPRLDSVRKSLQNLENHLEFPLTKEQLSTLSSIIRYIENKLKKVRDKENTNAILTITSELSLKITTSKLKDSKAKQDLLSGRISIPKKYPLDCSYSLRDLDSLDMVEGKRIITIDTKGTKNADGAFSVEKGKDTYTLTVYIADVPTFLMGHVDLAREAYHRGRTIFLRKVDSSQRTWEMLPQNVSYNILSLRKGEERNAICFSFQMNRKGELLSKSIDRKRIIVTDAFTTEGAQMIMNDDNYCDHNLRSDLILYCKLCEMANSQLEGNTKLRVKHLDVKPAFVDTMVRFPSIMVNNYIAESSHFTIYRNQGLYSKTKEEHPYAQAATPLRNFVSNINLAFFLNQNNVVMYPEKYLYYVEKNIDDIIEHLNWVEELSKLVEVSPDIVRKYLK